MRISKAIDTFLDYQKLNSKKTLLKIINFFWPVLKKNMAIQKYQKSHLNVLWPFWPRLLTVKNNQQKSSNFPCLGHFSILSKIHLIQPYQIPVTLHYWEKHLKQPKEKHGLFLTGILSMKLFSGQIIPEIAYYLS